MADIVNLRMARKRKERAQKESDAAANRTLHGRPKAERRLAEALKDKAEAAHEAHRRERPGQDD